MDSTRDVYGHTHANPPGRPHLFINLYIKARQLNNTTDGTNAFIKGKIIISCVKSLPFNQVYKGFKVIDGHAYWM